jgi:hypothetical protein
VTEDELFTLTRAAQFRFPNYVGDEIALGALVQAEVEAVEQAAGPPTGVSEAFTSCSERRRIIYVARPISAIVSVIEAQMLTSEPTVLASPDYRRVGDYGLARMGYGIWGELVEVTYHPLINVALRSRIVLDLVKLSIDFRTLARSKVGELELVDGPYTQRRTELLDQLVEAGCRSCDRR